MDYTQSRDYSLHLTGAIWIWPWAAFAVGTEHPSEVRVEAQRDKSCTKLVVFTSNEYQQRGEMSQTITGHVMVAGVCGAVKAHCPIACGLQMPKLPGIPTAAKGRDEGPVASCCRKPQHRLCSPDTWKRKMGLTEIILGMSLIINHRF